jgi:LmbE family N-acetylglucosaminyl deacetylase
MHQREGLSPGRSRESAGSEDAAIVQASASLSGAKAAPAVHSRPHRHGEGIIRRAFAPIMLMAAALAAGAMLFGPSAGSVHAQNRMAFSKVSGNSGHVALGLALRKLTVSGTFLQAPAHPDDETNALFAYFGYGQGLRVIDVQNNRGDGGQNEIGPELFRDIAVLRTGELLSAHRIDGAEQYFTRAIDYGYSFDPEEVITKWGRKDIVGDYVRLWRTLRPDVIVTMNIQGRGGDRAHEATTVLVRESFRAAGDPNMYPEQLKEGLRPWQPKKLYFNGPPPAPPGEPAAAAGNGAQGGGRNGRGRGQAAGGATSNLTAVPMESYDELLGRTYSEIAADARSNHKCQGVGGFNFGPPGGGRGGAGAAGGRGGDGGNGRGAGAPGQAGPGQANQGQANPPQAGRGGGPGVVGFGGRGYSLIDSTLQGQVGKQESGLFDGIDTSLTSIGQYASGPSAELTRALSTILADGKAAQKAFAEGNDAGTAEPAEAGLTAIRELRARLGSIGLDDSARYEIDFRLKQKERDYEDAVIAAHDLTFDAIADDGLVVGGQPIQLTLTALNHGAPEVNITGVTISGFDGAANCAPGAARKDATYTCSSAAHIPKNAKLTTPYFDDNYWKHSENQAIQVFDPSVPFGVPFAPSPYRVTFHVKAGNVEVTKELPVEFRYMKDLYFGDKRMELNVVPDFSARITPTLAVFPTAPGAVKTVEREIHVSVTNGLKGAAKATVALELPAGWKCTPPSAAIAFSHEDESLSARFTVTAPAQAKAGDYALRAIVTSDATGGEKFTDGYQEIEYPHIQRRQVIKPAEIALKVIDVKTAPNLNVGYIEGVGDQVPQAIQQLGAKLSYIDQDELAWGDLSKHDVIVTGVRAYERRGDLRAYNRRLLDYVERGGTVIVQYNKTEFNREEYGPFPAKVSGNRVCDENVPVKVAVPNDPVFNFPNKIGASAWVNWVQERGLYFLGDKDSKYVDLVSMTDSFKDNPGEKLGSLVEARYGKGRWLYLGLALWRQLPAGTTGAYQLMANLISLPKAPGPAPAAAARPSGGQARRR